MIVAVSLYTVCQSLSEMLIKIKALENDFPLWEKPNPKRYKKLGYKNLKSRPLFYLNSRLKSLITTDVVHFFFFLTNTE